MSVSIVAFVEAKLIQGANLSTPISAIGHAWSRFNNHSSTGRNNLYKYLSALDGVTKNKTTFTGICLRDPELPTTSIQPVVSEEVSSITPTPMTAFEAAMIQIELAKVAAMKESDEKKLQSELAKVAAMKESEEKKLQSELAKVAAMKESEEKKLQSELAKVAAMEAKIVADNMNAQRQFEIEKQKIESNEKIALQQIEAKIFLQREQFKHMSLENNKNRQMFNHEHPKFHPLLDLQVYGSHTNQYVVAESLAKNVIANVFVHDVFPGLVPKNESLQTEALVAVNEVITEVLSEEIECLPVIGIVHSTKSVPVIDINKVNTSVQTIVDKCSSNGHILNKSHSWIDSLVKKCDHIKVVSKQDTFNKRYQTHYEFSRNDTSIDRNNGSPKHKYLTARNMREIDTNNVEIIRCYVCACPLGIDSKATHRSHNVPKSDGGSWSIDNVRLCCANCNQDMGDSMTIEEYSLRYMVIETPKWLKFKKLGNKSYEGDIDR